MKDHTHVSSASDSSKIGKIFFYLMAAIGIVACAQMLVLAAGGDRAIDLLALNLLAHNSASNWMYSVVLALCAFQAVKVAGVSAKKSHALFWKGAAFSLLILSCAEICDLREISGWVLFPEFSEGTAAAAVYALLTLVFLVAGFRVRSAMDGSADASKMLLFGSLLFFAGNAVSVYVLATAETPFDAVQPLLLSSLFKMLGAAGFLAGLFLHEFYLGRQIARVEQGRVFEGIPSVKSENAAWTLRMIGTPTAEEINDETSRNEKFSEKDSENRAGSKK